MKEREHEGERERERERGWADLAPVNARQLMDVANNLRRCDLCDLGVMSVSSWYLNFQPTRNHRDPKNKQTSVGLSAVHHAVVTRE